MNSPTVTRRVPWPWVIAGGVVLLIAVIAVLASQGGSENDDAADGLEQIQPVEILHPAA